MAEMVKKELATMNGKEELITIYDSELIKHTERIENFRNAGNVAIINIAYELGQIDETECYKKAGFKNVSEYANVVFDYKRPTTALYVRVARAFLKYDENDGYATVKGDILPQLTVGQMIELLPLVKDGDITDVENAFINGDINQRMSTKKIRDSVKALTAIETTAKEEEPKTENKTAKEEEPKTENKTEIVIELLDTILSNVEEIVNLSETFTDRDKTLETLKSIVGCVTDLQMEIRK